jgi:hypothetical protein
MANLNSTITNFRFFTGQISLPNTNIDMSEGEELKQMIVDLEPKFLTALLGFEFADTFYSILIDGTNALGDPVLDSAYSGYDHISKILDGGDFIDKLNRKNYWVGFKKIGANAIANYIYCNMIAKRMSNSTSLGERAMEAENARIADLKPKYIRAWNEMVEWNWILDNYITYWQANDVDFLESIPVPGVYTSAQTRINQKDFAIGSFDSAGNNISTNWGELEIFKKINQFSI